MSQSLETGPVVKSETGPPTVEYRKASRTGRFVLAGALALMVIAGIAALAGSSAVALTLAGLCVALFVVALLLHFEGVRQRLRPDSRQPRKSAGK
jgi:membrane protein implicated in regulation of membrane protease activity